MLDWLRKVSRKPDHPMFNVVEAQNLLDELPVADDQKSLEEITFWLDSVRSGEGFRLDTRVDVLGLLYETGQPFQRRLYHAYISQPEANRVRRNRLWMLLFEFWMRAGEAYGACLDEFALGMRGSGEVKERLPVLAGRVVIALNWQRKLLHLHYRDIQPRIWAQLAHAYNFAESRGVARNLAPLHGERGGYGNVQRELLKAVMHEMAPLGAFTPPQIELADRIVHHFASSLAFREVRDPDCDFAFDLGNPGMPARLREGQEGNELMRYFGAGVALAKIEMLMKQIEFAGAVPADIDFGREAKSEELLEVLRPLSLHWSKTPPHRRHAREKVDSKLSVVHGFMEIRRKIAAQEKGQLDTGRADGDVLFQEQIDLKLYGFITDKTKKMKEELAARRSDSGEMEEKGVETWTMDNVSEGGLGAVLPQHSEWVQVGRLIGVRPEGGCQWALGIIRRLARVNNSQVAVGVQILSYKPQSIRLRALLDAEVSNWEKVTDTAQYDFVSALLLPAGLGAEEPRLALPARNFQPERSYVMVGRDARQHIKLAELLDQGEDFERVSFREVASADTLKPKDAGA